MPAGRHKSRSLRRVYTKLITRRESPLKQYVLYAELYCMVSQGRGLIKCKTWPRQRKGLRGHMAGFYALSA